MKFESEHFVMWYGNLFFIKLKINFPSSGFVRLFRPIQTLCTWRYLSL